MKKPEPFSLPRSDFFEQQENAILKQTTFLESWKFLGAASPEQSNPLPDSYWLQMEEGIRSRTRGARPEPAFSVRIIWKPALAGILLLLSAGLVWHYVGQPAPEEVVEANLNQLNQEEIGQYLSEDPAALELTAQLALQQIPLYEIELPAELPVNTDDLLDYENLNETDIVPNL